MKSLAKWRMAGIGGGVQMALGGNLAKS